MSVMITQSSRLGRGQLPAVIALTKQLAAVHKRLGAPAPRILESMFAGETSGEIHIVSEFASFAKLAKFGGKLQKDAEGSAISDRLSHSDADVARRVWTEVAVGDATPDADCGAFYTRAVTLAPGHDWSEAIELIEEGKNVCLADGASSYRVWNLDVGGSPTVLVRIGFPTMLDLWKFEDKTSQDPVVRALRMRTEGSSGHPLTTLSTTIATAVPLG